MPETAHVLVVDDDDGIRRIVERRLVAAGFWVDAFESADSAWEYVAEHHGEIDAILTDLRMPGMDGNALVAKVNERCSDLPVVVMTAEATITSAVDAIRLGAYDFIEKPFRSADILEVTIRRAVDRRRLAREKSHIEGALQRLAPPANVIGRSPRIREVFQLVNAVAPTDATVLVLGESGTGKELVARAIHDASPRRSQSFLPINCSALPDSLLESELFGYTAGAFTGARRNRAGLFEEADGGTLFLDEVGDISPAMQVRLLRVLQNGELRPVGATEVKRVDVRVVAATNRDLQAAIRAGTFREDLFYRLHVFSVTLPPLRDRLEDLPALAQHFLDIYARRFGKSVVRLEAETLEALAAYPWPGNVRELENLVQRAVILAPGDSITPDLLPAAFAGRAASIAIAPPGQSTGGMPLPFTQARTELLTRFERDYLQRVLTDSQGNMALAARRSQIDKSNFRRLARRYNLVGCERSTGRPGA
jgi:DNA-binding NtrC family response regulator